MASRHPEELFIALLRLAYSNAGHVLVQRRPTIAPSKLPTATRGLSYLALSRTRPLRPAQVQRLSASNERRRGYAVAPKPKPKQPPPPPPQQPKRQIAVLGGGITGLTAAHYLARNAPNAHITLYEASDRLGGWIHGVPTEVKTPDGQSAEVLMQRGPRMLRSGASAAKYDDLVLYDVVGRYWPLMFQSCRSNQTLRSLPILRSKIRSYILKESPNRAIFITPTTSSSCPNQKPRGITSRMSSSLSSTSLCGLAPSMLRQAGRDISPAVQTL